MKRDPDPRVRRRAHALLLVAEGQPLSRIALRFQTPPARVAYERTAWFRRGCRFRAGIEGRIGVLRRSFGFDRCRDHGAAGLGRWVGWGVVTANLAIIAHTLAGRSGHRAARAV